jgi:hypothetical protein
MSLDVYLYADQPVTRPSGSGIFVRENGSTVQISVEEWNRRNPDKYIEPFKVVPVGGETTSRQVFSANITHNLVAS